MKLLRLADQRRVPWRNGAGTTSEILVEPSALLARERFAHRVSIADVTRDGPFSRFEGYDRHIVVIAGAGMTLDCGDHGTIALHPFAPASFSGDWDVVGALLAGPVRDFNLIVDRERASSSMALRQMKGAERIEIAAGETCIVHVLTGAVGDAEAGDTLILSAPLELEAGDGARAIIARVMTYT